MIKSNTLRKKLIFAFKSLFKSQNKKQKDNHASFTRSGYATFISIALIALFGFNQNANAQFTAGRLVVARMGATGQGAAPTSAGTQIFLDEYTTAGVAGITVSLPATTSGSINRIVGSGSATSEDLLNLSSDGKYLSIGGYDTTAGALTVNSTTTTNRVIARVDNNGTVATTVLTVRDATTTNNSYTGNNFRSTASVDGTRFWMGGNGTASTGGIRTVAFSGSTTTSVIASQVSNTASNARVAAIYNGQLYYSTGSGTTGIYSVGTGTPTSSGTTSTIAMAATDPYQYVMINRGGSNWNCYIANGSGNAVLKFSSVNNGSSWTAQGSVATSGNVFGITGSLVSGNPVLYSTLTTSIITITDAAAFNANMTGSFSTLVTAPTNTFFRGISFAPSCSNNITASAGTNGSISPNGVTAVNCGANQTYTITPNSCYSIASLTVDGSSASLTTGSFASGGTYVFSNVTTTHTISATFALNTYNITASAGANGSISPNGVTSVNCGANQSYTITPNSCYSVLDVLVDGVSQGAITTYTFTNVTATHTISATFAINGPYNITASAGANGSISPNGITAVTCGATQSYTITPNSCYSVLDVLVDGVSQGTITTYSFTNVTTTHTISATFSSNFVTPSVSIGANPGTTICSGTNVTFTATPTNGGATPSYQWTLNGGSVGTNSATYSNNALVNGDQIQCVMTSSDACASPTTANSNILSITVTTTVTPLVSIVSDAAANTICAGTNVTFTATPTNGGSTPSYQWILNGGNVGTNSAAYSNNTLANNDQVSCVMTSSNTCASPTTATSNTITMTVNTTFTITASGGANGSITPSGAVSVNCGSNQTFNISANTCYVITDVLVDGVSQGAIATYSFNNVNANHTISATFSQLSYNITASAGANGSISPNGVTNVNCGANQSYTITPNSCYSILDVLVDGVSQGAIATYTFTNVTATHTISATFAQITYAITASAGANGTVSPNGVTNVNCNANQSYTITANANYSINDVLVDGVSQGAVATYTFNNVSATHTISASFVVNHLTLVGVPPTGNSNANLITFTVEARNASNAVDAGFTGSVTLTKASGSGNLTGTVSVNAVAGVATFSAAQFDAADTYTITASSGVLTSATSGNIVISTPAFVSGNLVVDRLGDGISALSSGATPVFLDEYSNSTANQTTPVSSHPFPKVATRPTASPFNLMETGSATSDGFITRSNDGTIVTVPGYNGIPGDLAIASSSSSTILRTLGIVNSSGVVSTPTALNMNNTNNFRCLTSDGIQYWGSGAGTSGNGINYIASATATTFTNIWTGNARTIAVQNGQLYSTTASASFNGAGGPLGVWKVGNGLPSTALLTADVTNVINTGASSSPYGFSFNSTQTICYVADDRTIANSGGIQKWTYSGGVGGTWSLAYTLGTGTGSTVGARGITVDYSGANPVIYATSAEGSLNRIIKITDTGAGSTATTLATSGTNKIFRGVAFAPLNNAVITVNSVGFNNNFGTISVGTSSASSSFAVQGTNLSASIVITPPTGYEIRTGAAAFSTSPISLSPSSGIVSPTTIDVRFTPVAIGLDNGTIDLTSINAVTQQLFVTGVGQTLNPPTHFAVTTISPSSPLVNTSFTVTVRSQDGLGQNQVVALNTDFTLSITTGTGTLLGTVSGTMLSNTNSLTFSGLSYNVAESGVVITATRDNNLGDLLNPGSSAPFTVLGVANHLGFVNQPTSAITNAFLSTFTVNAQRPDNTTDNNYVGSVTLIELSGPGNMSGTTSKTCVNGVATFNDITFDQAGIYVIHATSGTLTSVNSTNIVVIDPPLVTDVIFPQYAINGTTAGSRLPFVCRLHVDGLTPSATYKYTTGGSDGISNAGNFYVINNSADPSFGYITGYSSQKGLGAGSTLLTGDVFTANSSYGQFTTDATGSYEGWFSIVPTGNALFNAGNSVYVGVTINDGSGGAYPLTTIYSNNLATMLTPSNTANGARAVRGISYASPENMIFLYDNTGGNSINRPLWGTWAENDGITSTYSTWYETPVDGIGGAWGAYVPTALANGIQRVEQVSVATGAIVGCPAIGATGIWAGAGNTVNPTGGTSPQIVFSITDAGLATSYTITASAGANGAVTPTGISTVNCGTNNVYTITPDACYHVVSVLVDGVSVGAVTSYTFTNVLANHTISATFAINGPYTITASSGANGTVTPVGITSVTCGNNQHYDITPNTCYAIADVLVDGVSVGAVASYDFNNVTANHIISASFSATPAPVISACPSNITQCDNHIATWTDPTATGTPTPTVVCSPLSGSAFATGTTSVTCTATNSCGSSSCSFTVTINESPVIAACPANITQCDNHVATWTDPTATGLPAPMVTCLPASGSTFATGTTTVTCTATNSCGTSSCSFTVTINLSATAPTAVTTDDGDNEICTSGTITLTAVGGTLGTPAGTYKWYEGGCGSGSVLGTGTTLVRGPGLSVGTHVYYVRIENGACGNTTCASVSVVVTGAPPATNVPFPTVPAYACSGNNLPASTSPVTYATTYTWDGPTGTTFNSASNPYSSNSTSVTVNYGAPNGSGYNICVQGSNACGTTTRRCSFVRGTVNVPGTITPANNRTIECPSTSANYSITAVGGATGYTWSITGNATVVSSGTTATVSFGAGWSGGNLCVTANTPCYSSAQRCLALSNVTALPGAISGPASVCPAGPAQVYSVPAATGASTYNWVLPANASGSSSSNSISVTFLAGYTVGDIKVSITSICGITSAQQAKTITSGKPGVPASVSGNASGLCGQTVVYSCPSVSGATSYTWTVTSGTINSGQGSTSINTTFGSFTNGTVCVVANNGCGSSASRCLPVISKPAVSGNITYSPGTICANQSGIDFQVSPVFGTSGYNWVFPAGVSIVLDLGNEQIVNWGSAGGTVTVTAANACGNTTKSTTITLTCRESGTENSEPAGSVTVYPNPAHNRITVQFNATEKTNYVLNVMDLSGRVISTSNATAEKGINTNEINLSQLAKGVYMIELKSDLLNKQVRIVIE